MIDKIASKVAVQRGTAYVLVAIFLTILGAGLFAIGFLIPKTGQYALYRSLLHALAGATIGLGWIEVLHEWSIARQVRKEFSVLGDFVSKGIERVCTGEEVADLGREELQSSKSLKVLGIGISWLVKGNNRRRLEEMLERGMSVVILVPDPCAEEIIERYKNDEPPTFELGLDGLAGRIRDWKAQSEKYQSLEVRTYHRYPMSNVTIYSDKVYVGPVLYKRRAKDNLTAIYRRPSRGAEVFEDHFWNVYEHGSSILDDEYMNKLNKIYPA